MNGAGHQPDLHLVVRATFFCLRLPLVSPVANLFLLQSEDDFVYEQDIQRNPGSTKPWLAYINFKVQHGAFREQAFIMERACRQLPRSYKLWKMVSGPSISNSNKHS